jgi:hypothetical protein
MSQAATAPTAILSKDTAEQKHRKRMIAGWIVSMALVAAFSIYGFDYYVLGPTERPFSPKHALLRPSGAIGLNLGMFGVLLFFLIYLYPLRKKWDWLGKQGNSRHWLDFHVILGTVAPMVIALHSSFKFGGIAGMAFWIMTAVTLSGFVGRYLYAQIPRTLNAAELSIGEIQEMEAKLRNDVEQKHADIGAGLSNLLALPSSAAVSRTSIVTALCWMIWLDVQRPFQVSRLRLRAGGFGAWLTSVFGLLPTRSPQLELAIQMARRQASLSKRVLFLSRTKQVFSLWHVVHRPFSYSFAVLATLHILVALALGYR